MKTQTPDYLRTTFVPVLGLVLGLILSLAGCGGSSGGGDNTNSALTAEAPKPTPRNKLELQSFASCDALKDYYIDALVLEFTTGYWHGLPCWGCEPQIASAEVTFDSAAPNAPQETAANSGRESTDTNNQEAGVDQADLIEVDANNGHFYVLQRQSRELLVVDALPSNAMRIVSRTQLNTNGYPRGLYFDAPNQRLVVTIDSGFGDVFYSAAEARTATDGTELLFFDTRNPTQLTQTNRYWTEGYLQDSRRIDDRVHVVSRFQLRIPDALYDQPFQQLIYQDYADALRADDQAEISRLTTEIRNQVTAAANNIDISNLLPRSESGLAPIASSLSCSAIHRTDTKQRLGLQVITSIDTNGALANAIASINSSWKMYASRNNLYLIQSSSGWWFDRTQQAQSAIYRFAIDPLTRSARPAGMGLVDGWINNSYSLSEHNDHLRVASTENRFDNSSGNFNQSNHLSILALDPTVLTLSGEVRNFGPDERIFSARFLGDEGYVVTFRQTDPLFAFDLSDPTKPQLRGELEIPGFSTYIHPLGDEHLLTIGRAGGANGLGTGNSFQLQIFDVSNLANPIQLHTAQPDLHQNDYAYSVAEYEPLAFTFLDSEGLLSIPVQISAPQQSDAFSGFFAYHVDITTGIEEYARIDHRLHSGGNAGQGCPSGRESEPPANCNSYAPIRWNTPLRSAILKNFETDRTVLYTLSEHTLISTDSSGAQAIERQNLPLAEP